MIFLLMRVVNNMYLLQKCFKSKGESRHMIIKLANVHAKAQYLYEGNWEEERMGLSPEGM